MTIFVTGGAGFIGSNFILEYLAERDEVVVNIDKLTYASDLGNLESVSHNKNYIFVKGDIGDAGLIADLLAKYNPRAILNFAAETHVDKSISGPEAFIETNIVASFHFIEAVRQYWQGLSANEKSTFRFVHISTDEVYGSLESDEAPFSERHPYQPNNVYSASKASSNHVMRAYHQTYGVPVIITNCSNNFGPHQHCEKLIPQMIKCAIGGQPLTIYGDGKNIRDWLYVTDHCAALRAVLDNGCVGEVYNIGGECEKTNNDVVNLLCSILDTEYPRKDGASYKTQIKYVDDRLGHDRRYAMDASKIESECGWTKREDFETAILKTVRWYLDRWISKQE